MAADDHTEAVDVLTVRSELVDPGGTSHTGEISGGGGGVDVLSNGSAILEPASALDFSSAFTVDAAADGVTALVDVDFTDTHLTLENTDGEQLLKNPDRLHAGANCEFVDDGDNTATLNVSSSSDGSGGAAASDAVTQSGDGTTTVFQLGHSLGATPEASSVDAASEDASTDYWVSNATDSYVEITYSTAPASGTDNLSWDVLTHTSEAGSATAASTTTATGDGTTTTFTLDHALSVTPSTVSVEPTTESASTDFWVTDRTSVGVDITYAAAPADGASLAWGVIAHE